MNIALAPCILSNYFFHKKLIMMENLHNPMENESFLVFNADKRIWNKLFALGCVNTQCNIFIVHYNTSKGWPIK